MAMAASPRLAKAMWHCLSKLMSNATLLWPSAVWSPLRARLAAGDDQSVDRDQVAARAAVASQLHRARAQGAERSEHQGTAPKCPRGFEVDDIHELAGDKD